MQGHGQQARLCWLKGMRTGSCGCRCLQGCDFMCPGVMLVSNSHWMGNAPRVGNHCSEWVTLGIGRTPGHWPGCEEDVSVPLSLRSRRPTRCKEPGRPVMTSAHQCPHSPPPGTFPCASCRARSRGAELLFAELGYFINNQLVFNSRVITVLLNLNLMCIWETLI